MFDWQDYFYVNSPASPLVVGRYKVAPLTELYSHSIKEALIHSLNQIRRDCVRDVEAFISGNYGVFKIFDKQRSRYCRYNNDIILYPRVFKIGKENYARFYYSPYLEFIDKFRANKRELKSIIRAFAEDIKAIHNQIPGMEVIR